MTSPKDGIPPARMERAQVPKRYWGSSLSKIDEELPYLGPLRTYEEKIAENIAAGFGLCLHGPHGSGKTSVAVALLKRSLLHFRKVLFVRAPILVPAKIERTGFDEDHTLYERAQVVDLLVIDDVGSEHDSQFGATILEDILRERYHQIRATIITTNLEISVLRERIGEASVSLLDRSMPFVHISGQNWAKRDRLDVSKAIQSGGAP